MRESLNIDDQHKSTSGRTETTGFARTWTEALGFGNVARTFTEGWTRHNSITSEDGWTKRLMEEVREKGKRGVDGDIPAPVGFANEASFWRIMILSAAFGVVLGFAALIFLICAEKVPKVWVHNSGMNNFSDVTFYSGRIYYIYITGGTGLLVGLVRYFVKYPESIPGIFKEIEACHVEPKTAPFTVLCSAMSLAGGASLGPEQALGSLGGGLATYIVEKYVEFPNVDDRKLVVLCGMCASFGALFPTPVLGILLIYELGQPPKPFMESILALSCAAIVAFVVYYRFCENMYLEKLTNGGQIFSFGWDFGLENVVQGLAIGCISAFICLTSVVMIGVCRQVFNRIGDRLNQRGLSGVIICPLIGGVIVGSISYVLPLTIGDGNMTLSNIVKLTFYQVQSDNGVEGFSGQYMTAHLLLCSGFAKMFALAVSMNCGFVGGFVFPMITVGAMAGCVACLLHPTLPMGMLIACFMGGVPAAICPMPFTLLGICVYCFYFGIYQTVPIYVSIATSYLIVCGSGLFRKLADRGDAINAERKAQLQKLEEEKNAAAGGSAGHGEVVNNPMKKDVGGYVEPELMNYKKTVRPVAPRASEAGSLISEV